VRYTAAVLLCFIRLLEIRLAVVTELSISMVLPFEVFLSKTNAFGGAVFDVSTIALSDNNVYANA